MTEKHSFLTDKCFPSGNADSYAALAGQYKEPHHTGDIRIKRLGGSTTAKAALFSGHEVLDGNGVSVSLWLLKNWLVVETTTIMPFQRNHSNLNSPLRINASCLKLFPQHPLYPRRQVDVTIFPRLFFELRPKFVRKSDLILVCFDLFL